MVRKVARILAGKAFVEVVGDSERRLVYGVPGQVGITCFGLILTATAMFTIIAGTNRPEEPAAHACDAGICGSAYCGM